MKTTKWLRSAYDGRDQQLETDHEVEVITGATFAVMFDIKPGFCTTGDYYLQLNIQFDGKCQSRPNYFERGRNESSWVLSHISGPEF